MREEFERSRRRWQKVLCIAHNPQRWHMLIKLFVFSSKILHSTGLEFQHQVEEAKDLDQLIKIHYRYLSTIHDRCLLREKVREISPHMWPVRQEESQASGNFYLLCNFVIIKLLSCRIFSQEGQGQMRLHMSVCPTPGSYISKKNKRTVLPQSALSVPYTWIYLENSVTIVEELWFWLSVNIWN